MALKNKGTTIMTELKFGDLFAGGGGTTTGALFGYIGK